MRNLLTNTVIVAVWSLTKAEEQPRPGRIVGGLPVKGGVYPFYCITGAGALCGCSLIHPDVVISAAHCRGHLGMTKLYLGGVFANRTDAMEVILAGSELVHPNFDPVSLDNDVMLVALTRRSGIQPLAWNTNPNEPKVGEELRAIGMGKTSTSGPRAEHLLEVDVPVITNTACSKKYTGVTPNMFCAGGELGKDSCFGDSGSPILNADGLMVGIVSWGPTGGCGLDEFPGVYARTSTSVSFIRQGICELSSLPPSYCSGDTTIPTASPVSSQQTTPNDDCATSNLLETKIVTSGSTWHVTSDKDAQLCGLSIDTTATSLPGVWYHFKGNGAVMQVDTCGYDSQIIVYDAKGGCGSMSCLKGSNSGCGDIAGSLVKFESVYDEPYRVLVQTRWPQEFSIALSIPPAPPNLACNMAIKLDEKKLFGSTVGGAWIYPANECGVDPKTPGAWYHVVGGGNGELEARVSETDFASKLSVYTGSSCSSRTCVEFSRVADTSGVSSVRWSSQQGIEYWIAVHGASSDSGDFKLSVMETAESPPVQPSTPSSPTSPPSLRPSSSQKSEPYISWGKATPIINWGPPKINWRGHPGE